jgi:uncharacterized protein (DUF983 family)
MAAGSTVDRLRHALARALRLRCPRCGKAPLFRSWFAMNTVCAVCDLKFERAQGYWVGAIYVNYAVTTLIAVTGYFAAWRWLDAPLAWQLVGWGAFTVLFPLWFFRYSRSVWLAMEYGLNPEQ